MKNTHIVLEPIGRVLDEKTIEIYPRWKDALTGLGSFSHIVVLFWMDQVPPEKRAAQKMKPCYADRPKGVLATRMPFRPNPIGLSTVELVKRSKNILTIGAIDALKNSPVLDIKPYTGHLKDAVKKCRAPAWIHSK